MAAIIADGVIDLANTSDDESVSDSDDSGKFIIRVRGRAGGG